jgi:hypothetical protein
MAEHRTPPHKTVMAIDVEEVLPFREQLGMKATSSWFSAM